MNTSVHKIHIYDLAFIGQIFALAGFVSSYFGLIGIVFGLLGLLLGRNQQGYGGGSVRTEAAKAILLGTFSSVLTFCLVLSSHCSLNITEVTLKLFSKNNLVLGIGRMVSYIVFMRLGKYIMLKYDEMLNILFWNVCLADALGSLIARACLSINEWKYSAYISISIIGRVLVVSGFIAMIIYVHRKKRSIFRFLDLLAIQTWMYGIFAALTAIPQSYQNYQSLRGEIWSFWGAPQGYFPIIIITYLAILVGLYYGFKYIKWRGIVYVGYGVSNFALTLIVSLCMYDNPLTLFSPRVFGSQIIVAKLGYDPCLELAAHLLCGIVVFILICIFRTWRPEKRQMANSEKRFGS